MKVAVPTEVKNNEYRVAITPVGEHELVSRGHEVFVQAGAGVGSSIPDAEYVDAVRALVTVIESDAFGLDAETREAWHAVVSAEAARSFGLTV